MKKSLIALLALFSSVAFATTTVPVQLLNPTGSAAGQAIVSAGASTAPAWGIVGVAGGGTGSSTGGVGLDNLFGFSGSSTGFVGRTGAGAYNLTSIIPINSGGTNATTASAALANLGAAPIASPTFTGTVTIPTLTVTTGGAGITGGLTMSTGAITPVSTSGIVGTTTNNNANAGSFGEYPTNSGAGTSMTTATPANCMSESLTAGDWDVSGSVQFVPAASTTVSSIAVGISTTSATLGALGSFNSLPATFATGVSSVLSSPVFRVSLASTTTVYLIGQSTFGVSTMTCGGFIRARRVR